ncbi:phage major capsid protein [Segatella salivae]|uniref:phage major capsid protein n=1 Tax=Segatella salivae TaxID=228604 RepID=UPI0028EE2CC4|nr:phage major capsid protein [Segatella salivae]
MKKNVLNVRELINRFQQNCDRITEIADACEKEQRERNEKEENEYKMLMRENQLLQMKMQAATAEHLRENPNAAEDAIRIIRENAAAGQRTEIMMMRDIMAVQDVRNGSIVPLNIQEILKPLQEGFILDKLGLPMPTGLVGDFVWPMFEMVEAEIAGEGAALTDTKIPFNKMTASPERIGIAIPVSNQSLNQSNGLLEMIVREIMPLAIQQLLNKIVCGVNKVNNATNLVGPFVALKDNAVALSKVPTFKELNASMKAAVLETGIDGSNLCWVMTKSMQAILEGTPINDKGIFVPMIQNGTLCGLPVYTTNAIRDVKVSYQKYNGSAWAAYTTFNQAADTVTYIVTDAADVAKISGMKSGEIVKVAEGTEYIGLGDWRYQPMGLFGSLRFIVDPYSKARKDCVDFVLNTDYGTKTVRPEAFKLGKVAK